jgi:hypothetical protein
MGTRCVRTWEIDPYREGRLGAKDAQSFERHLRICGECRAQHGRDERLRRLGQSLGGEEPSELTLRRMRGQVLRDASAGSAPRRGRAGFLLAGALAVAAIGVGVGALRSRSGASAVVGAPADAPASPPTAPNLTAAPTLAAAPSVASSAELPAEPYAATVAASSGARWSRRREEGIERVALESGRLSLHVRAQRFGERFLVMLPDGEIEVRGTRFDVEVDHDATRRVSVSEGTVELRLRARAAVRLEAGDTWPLAPQGAPPRSRTLAESGPERERGSRTPPPEVPDDGYAAAMALLRDGHHDEAAAAFHAYAQSHPGVPQAEDASFLEAVALARAGRTDAAALAAERHLASFPRSFHRRDAAILAARAAAGRGECAKARALLLAWSDTGDAEVRAALGRCEAPTP